MQNTIKSVCVIIGTIIGAGFASGKEIYIFFNSYKTQGLYGIILASILTGIIIYKVLTFIRKHEIKTYSQYIEKLGLKGKPKEIIQIIINTFLLISFYIMIAGFCAYFKQELNISPIIISIIVAILCYITFTKNIEGVTKINTILMPFLIFSIIFIGAKEGVLTNNLLQNNGNIIETKINIQEHSNDQDNISNIKWVISSIEYASYNSIILIPMLIGIKKYSYKKEKVITIISSVILLILSITLYLILETAPNTISNLELPLIYITSKLGTIYKYIYGIVIVFSIFTSAISAGYGFLENCSKSQKNYKKIAILICLTSILVSKLGFSNLVNLLYPIFGILGIIQILYIIKPT